MESCEKYPFFQNQILRECFNQAPQQHHFCTLNNLSMLQKSLGYTINKFRRFYRVPEKIVIFKRIKHYKILAMNLSSNCFKIYQKLFLIENFDYRSTNGKRNWVSALKSSEIHYLSIGQGLKVSPRENHQAFL